MLTNETNLPPALYKFLNDKKYTRGDADISVSSLAEPPRKVALMDMYADHIITDVKDSARLVIGNAVHEILARYGEHELDDSTRLFMRVNGWVVSGQTDHYSGGRIIDYKTMSTREYMKGIRFEREAQTNAYAELLRVNGYEVSSVAACCVFVDWSPMQVQYSKMTGYPEASVVVVELPLWTRERAQEWILSRVIAHQEARKNLPYCTPEEVWGEDKWAVMKGVATRASKVFDNEEEARLFADEKGSDYHVEYRQGEPIRCKFYCDVGANGLCHQYNEARENEGVR
mgnify:FL=1